MATGETFRATIICSAQSTGTAFVFDFGFVDLSSGSAHLDTGTAAGNFQTMIQASLVALLPTDIFIRRYRFACVSGTHIGEIGYVEVTSPVHGALDEEVLPPEMCISLKRSTGHSSRRDRGRVFFGPCVASLRNGDAGDSVDTSNTALGVLADKLKTDVVTAGTTLKPVILSAAGGYSGRVINQVGIGPVFVHHKSRRTRVGV